MKTEIKDNSKLRKQESEQSLLNTARALFDSNFYLANNPDVKKSRLDPFLHFLEHGAKEGRSPHPLFDSSYYFDMAPDRDQISDNPLLHFIQSGYQKGFNPHPLFDVDYYRQQAGDLIGDENPLLHFLLWGKKLQLNPHPLFDTKFYLKNNLDAANSEINPLLHFLRYGKARRLTSHPLFDARFYLSKYPDIKKLRINPLAHFVWRGARERRWPNPNFDTTYYLKSIMPASFDNPLLHYIDVGQKQGLSTCAGNRDNRRLLETTLCCFVFPFLCFQHAWKRRSMSKETNYDHRFSVFKFWWASVSRFWTGCGTEVKLTAPKYLTQPKRLAEPELHVNRIHKAPLLFAYLYLANVFKIQGFFADAEYILRQLCLQEKIRDLALCSLGDLLLVQAFWASEFKSYESEGIALNPFESSRTFAGSHTWHKQTFDEALNVLEQAANLQNADAQWMLWYGYLAAGNYEQALGAIDKYPGRKVEAAERSLFKARAAYGLNQSDGVALRRQFLGRWSENCNIGDLKQASIADVPLDAVHEHLPVIKPTEIQIESTVIHNREEILFKTTFDFPQSYLTRFKSAQVIPEYGMVVAADRLLIKESAHVKPCHFSLFNSCIQEITENSAFMCAAKPVSFKEENCIYIGHNGNFYHWLLDELPRLSLIKQTGLFAGSPVLISEDILPWQVETLAMLGLDKDQLCAVNFRRPILFENLIVPSRLSRDMVAHPAAVAFTRTNLLGEHSEYKPTAGKRIYVARNSKTTTGRAMLNERSIIDKFKRAGFLMVDTSQLSIKEQIDLFSDAEVIAGGGGAGMANILFAPKGARVLTLGSSHNLCETFTSIAAAIGQQSWTVRGPGYARAYPYWIWTNFDYEIDEADIDYCFERIL